MPRPFKLLVLLLSLAAVPYGYTGAEETAPPPISPAIPQPALATPSLVGATATPPPTIQPTPAIPNLLGTWTGDVSVSQTELTVQILKGRYDYKPDSEANDSAKQGDRIILTVSSAEGQRMRALGGFSGKTLLGLFDAPGRRVPCADKEDNNGNESVTSQCFQFDGALFMWDATSSLPTGTQQGFHLSLRMGAGNSQVKGDFRIEPITTVTDEPQHGIFDLAEALGETEANAALAWYLHRAGEHESAFSIENRLLTRQPERVDLYWQRAQWLSELKRCDEALPDLRRVTQLTPDLGDAWGMMGWCLLLQGNFIAAESATVKAHELAPDNYNWTFNLGHTHLLQGDRAMARIWYEKGIPLIPDEASLIAGPLTDLDLFYTRGWQEAASREERAWLEATARPSLADRRHATEQQQQVKEQQRLADEAWLRGWKAGQAHHNLDAAEAYHNAAKAEKASGEPRSEDLAMDLNSAGYEYHAAGRYGEAEPLLREALTIRRQILPTGHADIAVTLNNLAVLLKTIGRTSEAEQLFLEALAIDEKAHGREDTEVARDLQNLAALLEATGRTSEAESLYRQALSINEKTYGREGSVVANNLNHLASVLQTTGHYGEAELLYREALDLLQKDESPDDSMDIADTLNNLALLLRTTGRTTEAEQLLREAVAILQKDLPPDHPAIASGLGNLGLCLSDSDRYNEAEPFLRQALEINKKRLPPGHPQIATTQSNLAELLKSTGRSSEAETLYREALAAFRQALPPGHADIAASLDNLAVLLYTTGRYAEAEPLFQEALYIAQGGGNPEVLWSTMDLISAFYANQHQRPLAIFYGKQAVNTLQAVRQHLQSLAQAAQQAFLKSKEGYYKKLADLLIADGRLPEAQQVLEMLKEQEYFDFLNRDAQADPRQTLATLNPFESEQAVRIETIAAPLRASYQEAETLRRIHESVRTPAEVQRLKTLEDTLSQGQQALKVAFGQVQTAFAALTAERQRQLTAQLHLSGDLRELVGTLGQGVALVQYLVLEDQLRILVTTPKGITPYQVPRKAADLNQAAFAFYRLLANPQRDPRPAGQGLYDSLIAPLAPQLRQDGIHTLMFALDGILRYLPLAALYDGQHYLSEDYALAIYTAAARDGLAARAPGQWEAVGLGVSEEHPGFSALPAVRAEIAGIIKRDPQDTVGVLPGAMFLDQAFTRDTLRASLAHGYPVVHLASHFAFRPGNEQQSFLLLGDGSHLDLGTLRTGGYPFTGVDLLTLSACDTALDSPGAKGQEIEGFGTLAQKQGAKGVIATLWPVNDASTGRFMQDFYRLRQDQHLSKAEALRQAQLILLRGPRDSETTTEQGPRSPASWGEETTATGKAAALPTDPAHPYAHPYYWAPFILMGNWL